MPFQPGHKHSKGKPKGAKSHRTIEFEMVLAKHNFCPATAMIEIFEEAKKVYMSYGVIYQAICEAKANELGYPAPVEDKADKYLKIAADMAKEISSYAFPKRKAIDMNVSQAVLDQVKILEQKTPEELLALMQETVLIEKKD